MPETEERKDLVQSHIDKLFSNLQRTWDARGRLFIATTILSVILIGISSGTLTEISDISAGGLNIKVSVTVLMCVGIFGVTILFGALAAIDFHSDRIRDEIARLYNSIGYNDPGLVDNTRTPLEGTHVLLVVLGSWMTREKGSHWLISVNDILGAIIASVAFVLLPIGAQIAASIWLVAQYSWHWLPLTGALVCILSTVIVIMASFMRS